MAAWGFEPNKGGGPAAHRRFMVEGVERSVESECWDSGVFRKDDGKKR
tara:strand:- start:445 stop:588 length:144 start_codon:yes stop_codon:yes gene_type:complete